MFDYNEKYSYYQTLHPDWSDDQIKVAISIDLSASDKITQEGSNVSPNDPELMRRIIEGARNWLRDVLPDVFVKVSAFFDRLITTVGEWIQKGLAYAINAIEYLYEKGKMAVAALKTPIEKH